jgi:hypothetical protein
VGSSSSSPKEKRLEIMHDRRWFLEAFIQRETFGSYARWTLVAKANFPDDEYDNDAIDDLVATLKNTWSRIRSKVKMMMMRRTTTIPATMTPRAVGC